MNRATAALRKIIRMFGLAFGQTYRDGPRPDDLREPVGLDRPFRPYFDTQIAPEIETFEAARQEALTKMRFRMWVAMPGFVVITGLLFIASAFDFLIASDSDLLTGGPLALLLLLSYWTYRPATTYNRHLKSEIFPRVVKFFGDDFDYQVDGPLDADAVERFGILPSHNRESTEDYIRGAWKGVTIELTEAHLKQESGSGKNRRVRTVFRGLMIVLSIHKPFKGRTIVRKDAGAIGNWFGERFSDLEPVRLEDPAFEDRFEVYSDDQVEARYLLTPAFMTRLLELADDYNTGKGLQCSFLGNQLLILVDTREDHFETGSVFDPVTFIPEINAVLEEMAILFGIIEQLKLHEDTRL